MQSEPSLKDILYFMMKLCPQTKILTGNRLHGIAISDH